MLNRPFHVSATDYIKTLIRQRKYLIASGQSRLEPGYISSCLMELDKYMTAYHYDTDQKMSLFWIRHSHLIYALIPGRNSGAHENALKVYHALNSRARFILENGNPWWQPLLMVSPN